MVALYWGFALFIVGIGVIEGLRYRKDMDRHKSQSLISKAKHDAKKKRDRTELQFLEENFPNDD